MSLDNLWFLLPMLGWVLLYHLEWVCTLLNLAQFARPLPSLVRPLFDDDRLSRCQDYHRRSSMNAMAAQTTSIAILLLVWLGGGFAWLHQQSTSWGWGPVSTGVGVLALVGLAQALLNLPFAWWDTFRIEADFGFNRTTPFTFVTDLLKSWALAAVLGLPLVALVLWFYETQPLAALWSWLAVAAFSLAMTWLSPRFLMPLFLRFQPLEPGDLRSAILALAARLEFPVADVSVVDGSRRSSKANAFFAGFGRGKRIALYDTLVANHSQDELLAVLAHEIGHGKRGHVPRMLAFGLLESALLFAALHLALNSPAFFHAFGVEAQPIGLGLVLFGIAWRPAAFFLDLASSWLSRKHEFEADQFARAAMGSHEPLAQALTRLATDHLAHPHPHPWVVRLHYSHPPLAQRLDALHTPVLGAPSTPALEAP